MNKNKQETYIESKNIKIIEEKQMKKRKRNKRRTY